MTVNHTNQDDNNTFLNLQKVLEKCNIGTWAVEMDPNSEPRLYGDEEMMKLLGIEKPVTPEEAFHALDDNIDKDHYDEVHEALDKMAAGVHAEVKYPWHYPDGRIIIIRCGGIRDFKYTKGIRIEGVHCDVTNMEHYDREKELLEQVLESEKLMDTFVNKYTLVFKVNLDNDNFSIIKRDNTLIRNPSEVRKFSHALDSFISTIVYDKDKEKMIKEIDYDNIRSRLKKTPAFSIDYRVLVNNYIEWHEMSIITLDEKQILLGIANRHKEILFSHLQDKMKEDFFVLFSIDLDTKQLQIIKRADWYNFGDDKIHMDYRELMKFFAQTLDGEANEFFMQLCDVEYTKKILKTEDKRSYSYQSHIQNSNPWVTVTEYVIARHEDGTPSAIILGFSILDSLGADKQELQNQLKKAVDMAQAANRAKTTFLNNMSHDIRTPMNAIIGYTNLAERHIENKEQVLDYLGKISHSSDHLLSLINDVLDMSRIESGKMNIEEKNENLFEIIETIKDIIQADINAKSQVFEVSFDNVNSGNIICDKLRLKQVLLNILSNSIKYTNNEGYISLSVEEKKSLATEYGIFEFRIKDNGMGMTKEFLEKIYEPFTRVKSSTVSGIQGTGLGMSITKNLVEKMNGSINIESESGKGTVVTVLFNFKLQKDDDINSGYKEKERKQLNEQTLKNVDLNGKKILLVEDNELNREIATIFLEENGMIIVPAEDGTIAVEKMKSAEETDFDLILMDIQMPLMDGYEATRQIRALKSKVKDIPIIAMTANAFEEDKKMAFEVGMNDYIAKPINLESLKKVLSKILN